MIGVHYDLYTLYLKKNLPVFIYFLTYSDTSTDFNKISHASF